MEKTGRDMDKMGLGYGENGKRVWRKWDGVWRKWDGNSNKKTRKHTSGPGPGPGPIWARVHEGPAHTHVHTRDRQIDLHPTARNASDYVFFLFKHVKKINVSNQLLLFFKKNICFFTLKK